MTYPSDIFFEVSEGVKVDLTSVRRETTSTFSWMTGPN